MKLWMKLCEVSPMNEAQQWIDEIINKVPYIKQAMYEDAKTKGTPGKAKRYAKGFKHDFDGFNATPEEQMQSVFNTMIENVIQQINKDADNAPIYRGGKDD